MNKNLLAIILLTSANFACANLQEKLAAKKDQINTIKQDVRAGKPIVVNEGCRTKGCDRSGCNKC